jgi:hypothetical protein
VSETRKTQQATRESVQRAGEAAQATTDFATRMARETIDRTEEVSNQTAEQARDNARQISVSVADTVARTADAALAITQKAAEQGREVMWRGMCAAAGVNGGLAQLGYGRSHRVLEQYSRTLEIYRQAGEATASHLQALFASSLSLSRGMQEMQLVALRQFDYAAERNARRPQDILRCKSMTEMAEVQRELCLDSVNYALEAGSTLLQIAGRVAQEAMRPLQGVAPAHT